MYQLSIINLSKVKSVSGCCANAAVRLSGIELSNKSNARKANLGSEKESLIKYQDVY